MRAILQQARLDPLYADSAPFSSQIPVPDGLIRGIEFDFRGTMVGSSAVQDDSPERLIANMQITFPLVSGDHIMTWAQRDAFLAAEYLTGAIRERTVPAAATAMNSSFFLPFGPAGWGFPKSAFRTGEDIRIEGNYAAPLEYGTATTAVTNGQVIPSLVIEHTAQVAGLAFSFARTRIPVESEQLDNDRRLNIPDHAFGLFGILYRQEDTSVAADRVDGLVTRLNLVHGAGKTLHNRTFRELRQAGLELLNVNRALALGATPEGLDGTAFYVAAPYFRDYPDLQRSGLRLTVDSAETVPENTTNVTPAAGDALHALVVGVIRTGG